MKTGNPQINIAIGGEKLTGWSGLQVVRSIDSAADAFSFSLPWNPTPENIERFKPFTVKTIKITMSQGDKTERVATGYIESISVENSANGRVINIQGRSTTGVLLEWSAGGIGKDGKKIGFEFNNITFDLLAEILAAPNEVFIDPNDSELTDLKKRPFPEVSIDVGQKVYDVLSRLGSACGLFSHPQPNGSLIFRRFNSDKASVCDILEGKSPVESISTSHDITKRFQEYALYASNEGEGALVIVRDFEALGINVRRRIVVEPTQYSPDYTEVANLVRARALINSYTARVTVAGWTYKIGGSGEESKLWKAGDCVNVYAPGAFILKNTKLIIKRATFSLSEGSGQQTTLDLGLPAAYDLKNPDPSNLPWIA